MSFREILLRIRADDDRERDAWRRAATISTYIFNYGTRKKRGSMIKTQSQLFPNLYPNLVVDYERRMDQAIAQEEDYLAQVAKAEARRAREAQE